MLNSSEKTSCNCDPSAAVLVFALAGVSGSIRPVRRFLNNGIFPTLMQSGFDAQDVVGASNLWTNVLEKD